ncbi:MAG: hypothetical protein A7315_12300 [Candidatus Altiarchaeales archaeon WOR_SM1_79]|nr:MAG: hypothetical protein A7315_12300 [Candidatus Altiarchaeales archaeon WOR_SM1_79]
MESNKENTLDIIKKAIELRKPIEFEYNKPGKVPGKRIGNPHAIFFHETTNNCIVHIFQNYGVTATHLKDWKWPLIKFIENVEILDGQESFEIADGYNPSYYKNPIVKI